MAAGMHNMLFFSHEFYVKQLIWFNYSGAVVSGPNLAVIIMDKTVKLVNQSIRAILVNEINKFVMTNH